MRGKATASRLQRFTGVTMAAAIVAIFFVAAPSAVAAPKRLISKIGAAEVGETGGRFNTPGGVAVNQTGAGGVPAGTVYVVESKDRRVQRFDPSGAFVSTWGFGVDQGGKEFEICTEAEECQEGFAGGTDGAAGSFESPKGIAVDQATGNVFVSDTGFGGRVDVFSAKGAFEGAFGLEITGDFSGELEFCTMQTGCGLPFFPNGHGGDFFNGIGGLAVDAAGRVYVANPGYRRVDIFMPVLTAGAVTGIEFLRSFGWGVGAGNPEFEVCTVAAQCKEGSAGNGVGQFAENSPSDVAVDSEEHVFALDGGNDRIQEFSSAPAPMTASFGAAALEGVFGAGAPLFNIAIDPSEAPDHLLVSGGRAGSGGKVAVAELDGSGGNVLGAGQAHGEDLTVTTANGLAVADTSLGGNVYVSTATGGVLFGVFVLGELPTVDEVTEITGTGATFKGRVVSRGIDVSYHFEYSTDGKAWTRVPAVDADAGAQAGEIAVEAKATDLTGSQPYRVRLVQNRPAGGGVATSDEVSFVTLPEKPAIHGTVASPVKDTSATFNAYLDPQNEPTSYRFEYGPSDCSINPCTPLPTSQASGGGSRLVTQTATGLSPLTTYHFRLVATNATGTTAGPDRTFQTFASGTSLPDDRAYELVTPPDTGAVVLAGFGFGEGERDCFDTFPATSDGNSVVSMSKGGSLPGLDVNGIWDLYESVRGPSGWSTVAKSASGTQSTVLGGGLCVSPDHLYSTLATGSAPADQGSLVYNGKQSNYIRVPGGAVNAACSPEPGGLFELIGCGSLGADPEATARWITEKATHIVFTSKAELEAGSPPSGTEAVYDRSLGGPARVVSLLPGNVTPGAGQNAQYQGASVDGSTVAFKLPPNGPLYARSDNLATIGAADLVAGQPLVCTGGPNTTTVTYEWLRNGSPIGGATANTYTTTGADEGKVLQCLVKAANGEGASLKASGTTIVVPFPGTTPPNPGTPAISGTAKVGQTLTCATGSWEGDPGFAFQWYRNGVAIGGATANTYVVVPADTGTALQCGLTGSNAGGAAIAVSAKLRIEALPPTASANPAITGTPSVGSTLSCSNGTWTNSPSFTYEWLRSGTPIGAATANTYTLEAADEGQPIQCRVTAANTYATAQAVSARVVVSPPPGTAPPSLTTVGSVSGTAEVGKTLNCASGSWTGAPTFTRQWLRNGTPIGGATGTSYTLVSADRGTTVQCEVKATNAGGTVVAINAAGNGARYVNPNPPAATATTPSTAKTFAGISNDGDHLFYQEASGVYDLDTTTQTTTLITGAGNAQLVNVAGDGSHVYFVSKSVLTGSEQNSQDRAAEAGENNLYAWDRTSKATHFVAVVDPNDVLGGVESSLTNWTSHAVHPEPKTLRGRGNDPSRTTPDGSVLLFESRADVTGFDSGGHIEIYRYESDSGALDCVSCPPEGVAASGDARLEANFSMPLNPTSALVHVQGVTDDGRTVFFETEDALVPGDVNETWDVYEWKAGQQAYLISSGHGQLPSHIYGMTPSGSDVFFTTAERLVPQDLSTVISIYDARVGGGFPAAEAQPPCQGDNCQGTPGVPPRLAAAGSASFQGPGNEAGKRKPHCRKNQRRVRRKGKLRCVRKHRHKSTKPHPRAGHNRRAGR